MVHSSIHQSTTTSTGVVVPAHAENSFAVTQATWRFFSNERVTPTALDEILFVAVLCGSESYDDFETFGNAQLPWLKKFFPFKDGIPSHDTYRRVFQLLDPKFLEKAYRLLIENLKTRTTQHIGIAIIEGGGDLITLKDKQTIPNMMFRAALLPGC